VSSVEWAAEYHRLCSASLILIDFININELGLSGRLQRQAGSVYVRMNSALCVRVNIDSVVVLS